MENEAFEEIVLAQKDLNSLINEQKFGIFCKIRKKDTMTVEFIDWISPKYIAALEHIYAKHIEENPAIVASVLRVNFLTNAAANEKIGNIVQPALEQSLSAAEELFRLADNPRFDFKVGLTLLDKIFAAIPLAVIRLYKASFAESFKKELSEKCLAIADKMKGLKARRNMEQFVVYENLLEKLEKLKLGGENSDKLENHQKNVKSKNVLAIVIGSVFALAAIIRLIIGMMG
ncbi:MAG: hypothetical protein ABJG68_11435 [Crocinitomicaceae bacterium]